MNKDFFICNFVQYVGFDMVKSIVLFNNKEQNRFQNNHYTDSEEGKDYNLAYFNTNAIFID